MKCSAFCIKGFVSDDCFHKVIDSWGFFGPTIIILIRAILHWHHLCLPHETNAKWSQITMIFHGIIFVNIWPPKSGKQIILKTKLMSARGPSPQYYYFQSQLILTTFMLPAWDQYQIITNCHIIAWYHFRKHLTHRGF